MNMKVGIIGATGKVGALIAGEAYARGHKVTAIVRDKSKLETENYKVLEKSLYDLTVDDVKKFDAVINCFGTPFGQGVEEDHVKSIKSLIKLFEQIPDVRFLMVGGAGSLYKDSGMTRQVIEDIPEKFRAVPHYMSIGLDKLRKSDVNWTYFSPAPMFDPKGARTGKYTLGGEFAIVNEDGEGYLSYADYAIAMIDELESGKHIKKRFTAVSKHIAPPESKEEKKDEYFGIYDKEPQFEGLSQYKGAFWYDLAGKSFSLAMDNGYDYLVNFVDGENLMWAKQGEHFKWEKYECLKSDETTYMVNVEVFGAEPRAGATIVLDTENSLVTVVIAKIGTNPKYPGIVTNDITFGAIKVPGQELPMKRHGFTMDLVGKRIEWAYSSKFKVTHVYFDANYIRVAPREDSAFVASEEMREQFKKYPYDERCYYIKIKEGLYIISFIETHMPIFLNKTGNNLLIIADTKRVHDVGRSFGTGMTGGPENYTFSAFGRFVKADGKVESEESKYRM